jgi:ankyrin repeat protein
MTFTTKDKVALLVAVLLGAAFGHFTMLAGFGGVFIGGLYGSLIVPVVVIYVADSSKILIWQACILPFALFVAFENGLQVGVFLLFWVIGSVISLPAPVFFYWRRCHARGGSELIWLFLGLAVVGISSFFFDPFLFLGLSLLWIVACASKFAWEWHASADSSAHKLATLVAVIVLIFAISTAASIAVFFKQQAFRSAMDHHDLGFARSLARLGADPNLPDRWGNTALVSATWNGVGDLAGVNALISMGANVNQAEGAAFNGLKPSGTALHVAAAVGRTEICKSLLEAGASADAKGADGSTPLLVALGRGSINCVPVLLEHRANVNARDGHGKTALMLLMNYGPEDPFIQGIVQQMVAKGGDVNAKDAEGKSVEDWAAYYKHERFNALLQNLPDFPVAK